jgi:hypothetical protein
MSNDQLKIVLSTKIVRSPDFASVMKYDRTLSMATEVGAIAVLWLLCSSRIFRFGLTVADVPKTDFYS